MNRFLALLLLVAGCGDDLELPACEAIGCPELDEHHKACASGSCTCQATACDPVPAPACESCLSLSCGAVTPRGVLYPWLCTCELESGDYVTCRAE